MPYQNRSAYSCALASWMCFLGLLLSGGLYATEAERASLRVMTFNIRYDNPADGENAWPHRRDSVAALIGEHADVAGLQEVTIEQVRDLRERLPDFDIFGVGREDGKEKGEFSPVLFRRDRFELVSGETFWLSQTPDVPGSLSWDAAITRLVTVTCLRERASGESFYFLNTHFDHVGSTARANSAGMIRDKLEELNTKLPVVVTGDFNCTPDKEPYRVLVGRGQPERAPLLFDTRDRSKAKPAGPDSTWNGFREIIPGRRIDFIFAGPTVEVIGHRTLDARSGGRFPSDHLPVVAEIQLPIVKQP